MVVRRSDADVTGRRGRQHADEMDQAQHSTPQRLLLPFLVNEPLGLFQQQARSVEILVLGRVEIVSTDNCAHSLVGDKAVGVVDDAKL